MDSKCQEEINVLLISFLPLIRANVQCTFEPACVTRNKRNQVTSKTRIGTKIIMTSNGALSGVEVTAKNMRRIYSIITFFVTKALSPCMIETK